LAEKKDPRDAMAPTRTLHGVPVAEHLSSVVKVVGETADRLLTSFKNEPPEPKIVQARKDLFELTKCLPGCREAIGILNREREALKALYKVGQAVNSSLDLEEVLNQVMDHIIELTGAERGFLMLVDEATKALRFKVARNVDRETIASSSFSVSRTVVQMVAHEGQAILTTNAQDDPRFAEQASVVAHNLRSILCVPLCVRNRLIGVIYADNRILSSVFEEEDLDTLVAFSNQAAVAIENARLFEDVTKSLAEITEMKNLMDDVLSSIASAVVTTDNQDRVKLLNRAGEEVFGISQEDAIDRPYTEVLAGAREFRELVEEVKEHESILMEDITATIEDRGKVSWRTNLSPVKDATGTTTGVTLVVDDLTEQRFVKETLGRYVGPAVAQKLLVDPSMLKLGGERRRIGVLFADLRGFTAFSEKLEPEQLIEILNIYLGLAADAVMNEHGTLDKFMGDAVMGLFGAPLDLEDQVFRAVRAAIAMQQAVVAQHERTTPQDRISFGVGINLGDAVVGNVGNARQQNYTAIGDCVNYAKRLQESAGPGEILLSQAAFEEVRDRVLVHALPPRPVKGRSRPEPVYQLISVKPDV
jgi:adenylate cyclase